MRTELEAILQGWQPVSIATPRGSRRDVRQSDMRRLLERIVFAENGCWLYTGRLSAKGYACFTFGGNSGHAHRFAYLALVGPIPEGLELDHRCHTDDASCKAGNGCAHRRCVNPAHLEAVTHHENLQRANIGQYERAKGVPHRIRSHCKYGHVFSIKNTYTYPSGKTVCRTCKNEEKARYRARQVAARKGDAQ